MNTPRGSGAFVGPDVAIATYRTWIPPAAGGEVAGARSSTTWFIVVPATAPRAVATAPVVELRICVQFWPPSVDWITPLPLMPAYRIRALAGELVSRTSERASPPLPTPCVQFRPASVDRKTPNDEAR
jgi:hypothetical protein